MPAKLPHLLGIADLSTQTIGALLDDAERWRADLRAGSDALTGRVIVKVFYENSTRTLLSFEMAAKRLGAHVLEFAVERSSIVKGESLIDTARALDAIGADILVVRHPSGGAPAEIAASVGCAVVNAGDGANEHPTQALIDALALRRRFGRLDGLEVAICGDIVHSRVARSNILLLTRMGVGVRLAGPPSLLPDPPPPGVTIHPSIDEAIAGVDAVMMLRIQHERMTERFALPGEDYLRDYGLTRARLDNASPRAVVMHPGPVNRDVEISGDLADDAERSIIWEQVALGVPVRMACLAAVAAG